MKDGPSLAHAAFLVFPAAAAGAWIIAAGFFAGLLDPFEGRQPLSFRGLSLPQGGKLCNKRAAVVEKAFITRTKVVESVLAVRRQEEAVFRTPTVAHGQSVTAFTKSGEPIQLGLPEGPLRRALDQFHERRLPDISEAMFAIDEVVTGKEVPVMLDDGDVAANLPKDAERMLLSEGRSEGFLEYLHIDAPDVLAQPFVKNGAKKRAESLGRHGAVADDAPVGQMLNQGQEPDVIGSDLLEKPVDVGGAPDVPVVHDAEDIAGNSVLP